MAATILHISLLVHFLLTNFPPTIAWNGTTPVQEESYFQSQALPIPNSFTNLSDTSFGSPNLAVDTAQQYIEYEGDVNIEALIIPEFFPYNADFEMPEILTDVFHQQGRDIDGAHSACVPNIQVSQVSNAENVNPETSNNAGNFLVWNVSSLLNQPENELPEMDLLKSWSEITVGEIISEQQHMNSYDSYGTQTVRTPRSNEMSSERPNMVTETNQLVNALHQRGHIDSAHAVYRPVIRRAETLNPEHFNPPNVRGSFLLSGSSSLVTQFENRLPEKEFHKSEPVMTAGKIIDEQQHTSPSDAYSGQTVTVFRCKRESAQAFPKASYQCSIVSCNQSMESF
ncbi:unnamed protein product, partial [Gongylonema pulchrum]|uniref:TPR_REGION domain-containing protein n=1 Tax=Gongylonema pulchrum TaxID=637853 RepID=A0A183DW63_9BILA